MDPYTYLENPLPKLEWKRLITKHVHQYWKIAIEENMLLYTSLKYLDSNYNIGRIHPLLKSQSANIQDIRRIPTRLKIVTGNKGNNKITELRTILQRESQNS